MKNNNWKFFLVTLGMALLGLLFLVLVFVFLTPYRQIVGVGEGGVSKISIFNLLLFYSSLFLFFSGLSATILFWLRRKKISSDNLYFYASTSFRQGILLGIFFCLLLFVQSLRILIWWDALLLLGAMILTEMYLAVK